MKYESWNRDPLWQEAASALANPDGSRTELMAACMRLWQSLSAAGTVPGAQAAAASVLEDKEFNRMLQERVRRTFREAGIP